MTETADPRPQPVLEMAAITKDFAGTRALDAVDFDVRAGEVHALIGENGAGKSTLMNVLAGRFADYAGTVRLAGEDVRLTNPRRAHRMGIAVIHQDLNVLANLTVAENVMLGAEPAGRVAGTLDRRLLRARAAEALRRLGFRLPLDEPVGRLGIARQQMVAVAQAIRRDARLLILDEPTASLGAREVEQLFVVLGQLKARGIGIVYITHRLGELPRIADRVSVLRDGRMVGSRNMTGCRLSELTRLMLGRDLAEVFPERTRAPGEVVLSVRGLSRPGVLEDVSFDVRAGEVLGIAGLVGSGRTEIARAVFGADRAAGTCTWRGRTLARRSPLRCRRLGIGMVPEGRKIHGNITGRSVRENVTVGVLERLSGLLGVLRPSRLRREARSLIGRMSVEPPRTELTIDALSGGNQQKVVVARWLAADCNVLIFDEPTQGIDVGTKAQMYRLIAELAAEGRAVVLISSELIELASLADRVLVVSHGRIAAQIAGPVTEDELFEACTSRTS